MLIDLIMFINSFHGSSPYSLLWARSPNDFVDYRDVDMVAETDQEREKRLLFLNSIVFPTFLEMVNRKHVERNEKFVRNHRMILLENPRGAQIMVKGEMRADKSAPRYEGPFTVIRRKGSGNYLLKGIDSAAFATEIII
jgi:hypothetical protein